MARADRLYEQLLGEAREFIGLQIRSFTSMLETQDPHKITEARTQLVQLLDRIEGDSYL